MRALLSITALVALMTLLPGCGCSREKKPVDGVEARMGDVSYTNMIVQMRSAKKEVARSLAAIRAEIAALGEHPEKSPAYAELTNRLAKCKADEERVNMAARMAIRDRILKNSSKKDGLKK